MASNFHEYSKMSDVDDMNYNCDNFILFSHLLHVKWMSLGLSGIASDLYWGSILIFNAGQEINCIDEVVVVIFALFRHIFG